MRDLNAQSHSGSSSLPAWGPLNSTLNPTLLCLCLPPPQAGPGPREAPMQLEVWSVAEPILAEQLETDVQPHPQKHTKKPFCF